MTNKRRTNTLVCPYKTNLPIHVGTGWNLCQELVCLSVSIDLLINPIYPWSLPLPARVQGARQGDEVIYALLHQTPLPQQIPGYTTT